MNIDLPDDTWILWQTIIKISQDITVGIKLNYSERIDDIDIFSKVQVATQLEMKDLYINKINTIEIIIAVILKLRKMMRMWGNYI